LPDDLKDSILSVFEASLEAQLRAVRRLHGGSPAPVRLPRPPTPKNVETPGKGSAFPWTFYISERASENLRPRPFGGEGVKKLKKHSKKP
jgi:hypothetical protein